jgi:DNA-directed RNA polymerase subunit L
VAAADAKDKNKFDTLDKYRLFQKNKYDEPDSFEFAIESECRLTPQYLVGKALDVITDKVSSFKENLGTLEITKDKNIDNFYNACVYNETHTLLNVLQSLIYNQSFRAEPSEKVLEYVGFHQSHPLDNKMVLKMKFTSEVNVLEFLKEHCIKIIDTLSSLKAQWVEKTAK